MTAISNVSADMRDLAGDGVWRDSSAGGRAQRTRSSPPWHSIRSALFRSPKRASAWHYAPRPWRLPDPFRALGFHLVCPDSMASSSQARRRSMFATSGVLGIWLLRTAPPSSRQLTIREGAA